VPEPIKYDEIIESLLQKTDEGKLTWNQVFSTNSFTCTLDGEFTFRVDKWDDRDQDRWFRLSMTDKENNEIFQVERMDRNFGSKKLSDLHEAARRTALNVEEKINTVKNILGRI
jgi:hypothetical protein